MIMSFLNTPGFCSGLSHIDGSMVRSASMCLQADRVIKVTTGIRATKNRGPMGGVYVANRTIRLMASAHANRGSGWRMNRRKPSRAHCQPAVAGRAAACMCRTYAA
ncbi:hypothetical protein C7R54_03930 [Achromobacter aloeverae]|uniref:Uncharacterized protein n=1 Tax=Achromobacter aloeverae TaxID=1750518 RepID=A0A4Q1HPE7_9BURK|nr:hypothetical protein C7R54_03930 [Achromobacter aloeverae]